MNFDEVQMTQSFKFKDSDPNNYHSFSSYSDCSHQPTKRSKYKCYQCDDGCFQNKKCQRCMGQQVIYEDDPLVMLLESVMNRKIQQLCRSEKLSMEKRYKKNKLSCSEILQEVNFNDQVNCVKCSSKFNQQFYSCEQCTGLDLCSQCMKLSNPNHMHKMLHVQPFPELFSDSNKQNNAQSIFNQNLMSKNILRQNYQNSPEVNNHRKPKLKKFLTYSEQQSLLIQQSISTDGFISNLIQPEKSSNSSEMMQINDSKQNSSNIVSIDSKASQFVFDEYYCNYCGKTPENYLYHCQICEDYDLCKYCYWKFRKTHQHDKFEQLNKEVMEMRRQEQQAIRDIKQSNYQNIVAIFTGNKK